MADTGILQHRTDKSLSDAARKTGQTLKTLATVALWIGGIATALLLIGAVASEETYTQPDMSGPYLIAAILTTFNTALSWAFLMLGGVVAQYIALRTAPVSEDGEPGGQEPVEVTVTAPEAPAMAPPTAAPQSGFQSKLRVSRQVV